MDSNVRIKPLDTDQATGDAAKALASPVGHMTLFRVLAHADSTVLPMMRLGGAILAKPQDLDARTREMLVLLALAIEGGRYEWPQHVEIGLEVGVTEAEVSAIEQQDISSDVFSARDQAVLMYGREVIENVQVEQSIFDAVKNYLSEKQMVEAVVAIGFYMMLARVTESFNIGPDPVQGRAVMESLKR